MASITQSNSLYTLPNELLLHILFPFSTLELLPLAAVSCRFHDIILRIVHRRLVVAAGLAEHILLLECYHPSQKLTEPPLFCHPLGTDGLNDALESRFRSLHSEECKVGRLGELNALFTRFRPRRRDVSRLRRRHPAGDVPGSRTYHSPLSETGKDQARKDEDDSVLQMLSLDAHELFTQLCIQINLAKPGPKPGIFLSFVEVEDGVLRVWRDWMSEMDKRRDSVVEVTSKSQEHTVLQPQDCLADESTLWIGPDKNIGVKLRVTRRNWKRDVPILFQSEEEIAVSYQIEYKELLIRTSHLLLKLEQSLVEQSSFTGKAVIFGTFR